MQQEQIFPPWAAVQRKAAPSVQRLGFAADGASVNGAVNGTGAATTPNLPPYE
jgi:hypothetical protein